MTELLLLGNGFDLSHKLKTSYGNFISRVKETDIYYGLYARAPTPSNLISRKEIIYASDFIKNIMEDHEELNWCDIEKIYFDQISNSNLIETQKINESISHLKQALQKYLKNELNQTDGQISKKPEFEYMFSKISERSHYILNFNYTNIINSVYGLGKTFNISNIHGDLNNIDSMVLGYGANSKEENDLSMKRMKGTSENLKQNLYNSHNRRLKIQSILKQESINVHIIGHSLGYSDSYLLEKIFRKNITSIHLVNQNLKSYNNLYGSLIEHIPDSYRDSIRNKVIPYEQSLKFPGEESQDYKGIIDNLF